MNSKNQVIASHIFILLHNNYRPSARNVHLRFRIQNSNVIRQVSTDIESFHRLIQQKVYSICMHVLLLCNNHVTLLGCWNLHCVSTLYHFHVAIVFLPLKNIITCAASYSMYHFSFRPRFLKYKSKHCD